MSQANRVGKQNARERVAAEKIKRQRAERRRKQITIGSTVIAVIAVAGGSASPSRPRSATITPTWRRPPPSSTPRPSPPRIWGSRSAPPTRR
ncbi:hypothetical protein ACFQ9X_16090 [Catenulispora yoronensis]